jgi:hypothetical protein
VFGEPVATEFKTTEPTLVKIIQAWSTLPEPIRRGMLAFIG